MNILLIDDSNDIHMILKMHIKKEGHDLLGATSGPEGIQMATDHHPDLILLDIDMPEMTGYEVCTALKNNDILSKIPIIFLTGSGSEEEIVRGLDLGAVDYVKKPFNRAVLSARIRAALRTKHLHDLLISYGQIDPLTELGNRRALEDRLNADLERIKRNELQRLSFIMLDIDKFKNFNDAYGHLLGDEVLIMVAKVLQTNIRKYDLAIRFGGEEFSVILPNTSIEDATHIAQRCRMEIEVLEIKVNDKIIHVTASFGIACITTETDIESLISIADQALYKAKENGRNRIEFADLESV
jgi:diguanylate cyclase (GGDEF)-like protein